MSAIKEEKYLHFFLGANTPQGFVSRFDQLGDPAENWRSYIIKGGPGSGKSTLMKRVCQGVDMDCPVVELIHCSSDVDSLDAVIFPSYKVCIADGTPPHALEPKYPGAFENLVPLCTCWDSNQLFAHLPEIMAISTAVSGCHKYCVRFLTAAGSLLCDTYRTALEFTDTAKIARYAASFAAKEFRRGTAATPKEAVRFLSAITNKGPCLFAGTAKALASRLICIEDAYGAASRLLLMALRSHALAAGYNIISCYCPLAPFDKLEHLFIPELGLGLVTRNRYHLLDLPFERIIHERRFMNMEQMSLRKKRISFNAKATVQMLGQAEIILREAKAKHDALEQYYVAAMDFAAADRMAQDLTTTILQGI